MDVGTPGFVSIKDQCLYNVAKARIQTAKNQWCGDADGRWRLAGKYLKQCLSHNPDFTRMISKPVTSVDWYVLADVMEGYFKDVQA